MRKSPHLSRRSAGLLLHPTSLPGPHGIGDIGPSAFHFIDFLAAAGQTWWQMLPIGPLGYGSSPYNSMSAFAGNPLLISLESLKNQGLLSPDDIEPTASLNDRRVDYHAVEIYKRPRLQKAFHHFVLWGDRARQKQFEQFVAANREWLQDFGLFCALKRKNHGKPWTEWAPAEVHRKARALDTESDELRPEIEFQYFLQFVFWTQWKRLKEYAADHGVALMGDVPIFVAYDSADVWANQKLFKLDPSGHPKVVAGVPPDYFSQSGQLWGNPVYNWRVHKRQKYRWWVARLAKMLRFFDAVRLDHFIGFERTWEVPAGAATAQEGRFVKGPSSHFFRNVLASLGRPQFVAEDLGTLTPAIHALRDRFNLPGMFVLQFAFAKNIADSRQLISHVKKRTVTYTGTHDNDTIQGWFHDHGTKSTTRSREENEREHRTMMEFLGATARDVHWKLIELAYTTKSNLAIVPVQDLLGLGATARMNKPGTSAGNWEWRLAPGALTPDIATHLKTLARKNKRI